MKNYAPKTLWCAAQYKSPWNNLSTAHRTWPRAPVMLLAVASSSICSALFCTTMLAIFAARGDPFATHVHAAIALLVAAYRCYNFEVLWFSCNRRNFLYGQKPVHMDKGGLAFTSLRTLCPLVSGTDQAWWAPTIKKEVSTQVGTQLPRVGGGGG